MMFKCVVLFAFVAIASVHSAKILGVFPLPIKSHHILGSALLKELAIRGHDVTVLSTYPLKDPPKSYKDVDLKGLLEWKQQNMKIMDNNGSMLDKLQSSKRFFNLASVVMENEVLKDFLKTKPKFDLVIQNWFVSESLLGIGHAVNATTIAFSVVGTSPLTDSLTLVPTPYSYVPNTFLSYTDDMTFFERVVNTLVSILIYILLNLVHLPHQQSLLRENFPGAPPLQELMDNVDLVLMNSHFVTEAPRPYLSNMIQIGGFHLQEKQTMPEDLKHYLDNSKHGVVYFSLGSNVESTDLPDEKLQAIIKAFGRLKYDVLWKFNGEMPNKPKNIKISKWLPQRAILDHPKVKLFITHGGLGSTVESIYSAVPMLCIPIFGDQKKNAADTVANGYGLKVEIDQITEDAMVSSIVDVIENKKYKDNIQLKSELYRTQEMNPMDKAVFWVEHVLKHKGAKHLKTMASSLPLYQYMLIDVIAFILSIVVVSFAVMYLFIKVLVRKCCKRKVIKSVKAEKKIKKQ